MLGFEAHPVMLFVNLTSLTFDGSIEEIARIKLNPGLGCKDIDFPSGYRIFDHSSKAQFLLISDQYIIMVITSFNQFDPLADAMKIR